MEAFSLPAVMVIAVLVMLLILSAFSLRTLDFRSYSLYREGKQRRLDLRSATALYMCDSTLLAGRDSVRVSLYGEGEDSISIVRHRWGFYEAVTVRHGADDPFGKTYLMGREAECSRRAALWLCDHNRPLSLAGRTSLKGTVYVPLNGINYIDIDGKPFGGRPVPQEMLRVSRRQLPRMSDAVWAYLDSLKGLRDRSVDWRNVPGGGAYRSFGEPAVLAHCDMPAEVELHLAGNVVLFGDRVVLSGRSEVRDILIIARSVIVGEGFRGSAQIICADSVRVRPGVRLEYPSGIFIDSSGDRAPGVVVGRGSSICGYVGIIMGEKYHYYLENPCFTLDSQSSVRGLLYIDGSCNLAGDVTGAAYIGDCFYRGKDSFYAGTLNDVTVARDDSLAFPLMLDGPYRRKIMKNLY